MRVVNNISKTLRMSCVAFCFCLFAANSSQAAVSSITIDAGTGKVISASNADQLRYPASLTKLMTLYITFDALEKGTIKLDDELKISHTAANRSPSRLGLTPGETITVKNAILALVVKSANDCASVLAENLGKDEENFAKTMTKTAKKLGMKNTTFKNASGLPNKQQKTTARDMAILGAAVYHHFPQYYHFFSTTEFTYNEQTYKTHNPMLKAFSGADGMKTGYTSAAGYNIVTSAERNGSRVISVTMGHKTSRERDKKVYSMMDSGLTKLAMNTKVTDSNLYAKLEEPKLEEKTIRKVDAKPVVVASLEEPTDEITITQDTNISNNEQQIMNNASSWGIQVGAFSNYAKARNYALQIQKEIPKKYAGTSVDIEAAQKGGAVVYRSKIIGFEKNAAKTTCNDLKKSKKSCIVIANSNNKLIVAQHDTRQEYEQY